jgi:type 1 fimbria pilin
MAYLGRQPIIGNYQVLDAITATATDTYALTKGGVAVFPQTPANCIVSLNGVIQAPFSSYNISGSNIVFASALTGSDSIDFITVLGDVLNVGTVSDGTIGLAKLSATGTKDATTFLRGDNTFAEAGGGKVLQVVQATVGSVSTTSTSDVDTGLTASITPFSVSNKILIFISHSGVLKYSGASTVGVRIRLYKDGSNLQTIAGEAGWTNVSGYQDVGSVCINYLDSPATTSSITYKTTIGAANASATVTMERGFITLMEIAG